MIRLIGRAYGRCRESMNNVGGKLLNGTNSLCVSSLGCVSVKGCEIRCFRIESDVRQSFIMSPWLFNVYMGAMVKEVKMRMGRMEVRFLEVVIAWPLVCR